ncbi:MAG TPA: hypothetical protein VM681_05570 [Candidatus Thermoplasmatota archaeon]|nr:hypothetical protein [Candidatus Thermoplasmatota archaeon]
MTTTMLRIALVTAVCVLLPAYFPVTSASQEGLVYTFRAGEEYRWNLPPENYLLVMIGGETGATVDVSKIVTNADPNARVNPRSLWSSSFESKRQEQKSLTIEEGTGRLVISRLDFGRDLPYDRPIERLDVQAYLTPGECRAYHYQTLWMDKPYWVGANGTGVSFTLYGRYLDERKASVDNLTAVLDAAVWEEMSFLLQACNETGGRLPFAARIVYPVAGSARETPGVEVAFFIVTISFIAALLSRRRR